MLEQNQQQTAEVTPSSGVEKNHSPSDARRAGHEASPTGTERLSVAEKADADKKYEAYKQTIWEIQSQSYQQSDNLIITISSGVLALSVSFIGNFFGKHPFTGVPYLIVSWSCLGASILAVLASHWVARKSQSRSLKEYATSLYRPSQREKLIAAKNPWRIATGIINFVAALGLSLGIILMIVFASLNAISGNEALLKDQTAAAAVPKAGNPPATSEQSTK